jgi:hypothetical protein
MIVFKTDNASQWWIPSCYEYDSLTSIIKLPLGVPNTQYQSYLGCNLWMAGWSCGYSTWYPTGLQQEAVHVTGHMVGQVIDIVTQKHRLPGGNYCNILVGCRLIPNARQSQVACIQCLSKVS